jgi:predicted TIM-barrel fold metal-dependent hydrolase
MLCDAHCHFFSSRFFTTLAEQRGRRETGEEICRQLAWDEPGTDAALSDRWVQELDRHGVSRAALIASVPGDEASVGAAVSRHPDRLVGFFMIDPAGDGAVERASHALDALGLRGLCLFPAMHHLSLSDPRVEALVRLAAERPGTAVFVHCGVLAVGVRGRLGLPSRFDLRLGDPLGVSRLALAFPHVPFIVPHFGAGLLRETLMAGEICPNIHVDSSSSNRWMAHTPGLTLEAVVRSAVAVLGPTRVLFGTDSSFFPRGWQSGVHDQQRTAVGALGLGEDDRALIFGGNFDRLFPAAAHRSP